MMKIIFFVIFPDYVCSGVSDDVFNKNNYILTSRITRYFSSAFRIALRVLQFCKFANSQFVVRVLSIILLVFWLVAFVQFSNSSGLFRDRRSQTIQTENQAASTKSKQCSPFDFNFDILSKRR